MAKLNEDALKIQKEFLPLGTEMATLTHKLYQKGCYLSARLLQQAQEEFHRDVQYIVEERKRK